MSSQDTISSSSQMSSYDLHHSHPPRPVQPSLPPPPPPLPPPPPPPVALMATTAALHARMALPSLSVHPPPDSLHPTPASITHYDTAVTPSEDVLSPISSSPDSPQAIMSTTATPVVPLSAAHPQRNPFPSSPSIAASTAGSKRTASGTFKSFAANSASVPSSPAQPATPGRFVRSQTSVDPSPRNVSQLSSQLRARLSYALLKVQNNWTTESLDQVEARISSGQQPSSPTSRVRVKREPSGDETVFDHIRRHQRTASEPGSAHPLSNSIAADATGRTYESFWREHEPNPITKKILQAKAASQALGSSTNTPTGSFNSNASSSSHHGNLQPPAQIIPDRDRRSYWAPGRQPPTLIHSTSTHSNASTISMVPNTPPPPPSSTHSTQRTMEQDAVESLMFLSSPGNSQHFPAPPPSASRTHHPHLAPPAPSPRAYSYARNATTWPRSRRGHKQARTSLGQLGMMGEDSGVGFDEELTDEDVEQETPREKYAYGHERELERERDFDYDRAPQRRAVADGGDAPSRPPLGYMR
ncbi:hypothetical protein EDC01DRAFT_632729 [Geopyxis carbonaria]|nr:hypothetical protein EDC01DRAFT_632729 [Geopyxis carbonaria]